MNLPYDLISQFAKITKDDDPVKKETTVYGTVVSYAGSKYVKLDGSELLTPMSTTVDTDVNDRVTVLIKNHTATVTGNLTSPAGKSSSITVVAENVAEFEKILADVITTEKLEATKARIDILEADNVTIKENLSANNASINTLEANDVNINKTLTAQQAAIDDLKATTLTADTIRATYATIASLDSTNANVTNLLADVANIDTLIFGSASGDVIQTSFSNSVIAQLGDAQIKSAMIESVSADKITAGDIITNNVRVKSEDGSLIISDETMQISDSNRVRVQIGKDAANDYSINIWDQNGNLMFSKGGITDSAIKDAIIRNDMVSDTANIAAHKLDIDSLFEEINDSTNTIKSTKVYLDDEKQTLDVAFKSLSSTVTEQGETITSQGTAISTIQGQITSKIWQQDINTAKNEMSTQYSTLEQNLSGFKTSVSETYATLSDVDNIKIGGRNWAKNSNTPKTMTGNNSTNQCFTLYNIATNWNELIGQPVTVSFDYEFSEGATASYVTVGMTASPWIRFIRINPSTSLKGRAQGTLVIPEDTLSSGTIGARCEYLNGEVTITNMMFEIGTKPSAWRPAPEDMATQKSLTAVETSVTQNADAITAIASRTSDNESSIASLELTATGLTAKVDTVQSTANAAKKQRYHSASGTSGASGYVAVCSFEITAAYMNRPILFELTNRGVQSSNVSVCFNNTEGKDPSLLHFQRDGGISCWMYKVDTSLWHLIVKKSEGYDTIYVKDFANNNSGINVTWTNVYYAELPTENITADTILAGKITKTVIDDAAKTATNYLNFSANGLVVGDMTAGTLGKNILIDYDSVDIRDGNSVRASFGEDYVYLAKHNSNAKIDLCNSKALLYHEIDSKGYSIFNIDTTYGLSYIKMSSPMHDLLVLENTAGTNGVIIKGVISGTTIGGFGLVRDGYLVRYGSDADDDNPVEYAVLDTGNFLTEMDDGWHYTGGYGEEFTQYNNENYAKVRYRKIGGVVEIRGVMRPTTTITGSTTQHEMFQLPDGYRPDSYIYQRCSGNYSHTWLLTISPAGKVSFSRYGNGATYLDVDTTAWLPFQITFFVD